MSNASNIVMAHLPFLIALDHQKKAVVLAIRGTISIAGAQCWGPLTLQGMFFMCRLNVLNSSWKTPNTQPSTLPLFCLGMPGPPWSADIVTDMVIEPELLGDWLPREIKEELQGIPVFGHAGKHWLAGLCGRAV